MEKDNKIRFQRQQATKLSESMIPYLKSSGLWYALYRNKVFEAWNALSGAGSYTINKYLKDNILYITLSSSALRNRLQCQLPCIMATINESLEKDEFYAGNPISAIILK